MHSFNMYLSVRMINYYKFSVLYDFFELLIFWYHGAMETTQHGNASTWKRTPKNGNLPKMNFFEAFPVFSKNFGNSLNLSFRGVSHFFDPFPRFLDFGFRFISQYFWGISQYFWGISQKSFKISVCWLVSSFFRSFSSFFGPSALWMLMASRVSLPRHT